MRGVGGEQAAGARLGIRAGRIAAGAADQNGDAARIIARPTASTAAFISGGTRSVSKPGSTPGTPARLRGRLLRRQVSWLAGRRLRAAFPGRQCPVAIGRRLVAYSCGDSRGFGAGPAPHSLLALPLRGRDRRGRHLGRAAALPVNARGFRFAEARNLAMNCRSAVPAREPRGNAVRIFAIQSRGCPRNCKRQVRPKCH